MPECSAEQNPGQNEEAEQANKQKEPKTPEIADASTAVGVSLKQHVRQDDAVREEAMRSFILDRFLPAAKAVAADHESSMSVASRNRVLAPFSSMPQPTHKAPSSNRIKSRAQPPSNAFEGVSPSRSLHSKQQEKGRFHSHDSMKSCGFFCVGLKTALFRAHRTVSASARTISRSKGRASRPSIHVKIAREDNNSTSSDEKEAVVQKVKPMEQGIHKQWSALTSASISYSPSSPTTATFQGSSPSYAASVKENFPRDGSASVGGSPVHSITSSGSTPLQNQSGKCSLKGSALHHQNGRHNFIGSPLHDHIGVASLGGTPLHEQAVATSLGVTVPEDQGDTCNLGGTPLPDHARGTPLHDQAGGTSLKGTPLHDQAGGINMNNSPLQDQAGRTSSKSSPAHDYTVKSQSPGQDQDGTEDDEPPFYDALSGFNSVRSTTGNVTSYTVGSPKSQNEAFGFPSDWTNDEAGFTDASSHFETPRASTSEYKSVGSDAGYGREGWQSQKSLGVKTSSLSQRVGKVLRLETGREQEGMHDKDNPNSHLSREQGASADPVYVTELQQRHKQQQLDSRKESSSRMMRRPSLENMNGICPSNTSPPIFPAKCQNNMPNGREKWASANNMGWPLGISSCHSGIQRNCSQEQQKSYDRFVPGLNMPSPPLPPSPTGSWLEKAITMNASKPSPLATLQQKDKTKTVSARKKLEFLSTDAAVAELRWEDVVKGSQMQPGHSRFSEELHHHHHPSNLNALKPLRL